MNLPLIFLASSIWVLALYLLNKVFNYKDKLIRHFGIAKYKIMLLIIFILAFLILRLGFNIDFFGSTIEHLIFWSYLYLITNPEHFR
ncbi:hypothetical protein [Alkaliphilus metalliredigens]|uniref:hypothetical protein n=1 Tax=Alkaliphilus metalliredigens TaxID=208226 RepID=UPI00059F4451|nr:hypothetical protein [Alkaliphilus metalliredigens]